MALARTLSRRLARIEKSVPTRCPGCAGRRRLGGVLFQYSGRLTDGEGHDVDGAALEPCNVCGRDPLDDILGAVKILGGLDPKIL